ncbi:MAG TPA: helix-turn-helix domain-containing protein [Syntrophales bacterium]|nr:helix-turn-helix domain-containing protein [Syntrophales bacterium]
MNIGERIRLLRKSIGLTQEAFAEKLGVVTSYISLLETGKNEPSEQLTLSICRTYGIRYDWLTKGEEPMKEEGFKSIGDYKIKEDPPELLEILEMLREEDQEGLDLVKRVLEARRDIRNNLREYVIDKPKKKK